MPIQIFADFTLPATEGPAFKLVANSCNPYKPEKNQLATENTEMKRMPHIFSAHLMGEANVYGNQSFLLCELCVLCGSDCCF